MKACSKRQGGRRDGVDPWGLETNHSTMFSQRSLNLCDSIQVLRQDAQYEPDLLWDACSSVLQNHNIIDLYKFFPYTLVIRKVVHII